MPVQPPAPCPRPRRQWAGQAWDELCYTFDFAAAARKIGMLMTRDGTNDDLIRVDGVEKYTFTDADASDLPANEASDEEEQGRAGGAVALDDSDGDDEEGEEAPTHTFDDDSEDDTAHPQQLLSFVGAA